MAKVIIETGRGEHTTSSASLQAKFNDGKYLYQVKQNIINAEYDNRKNHEQWVKTEYNLPDTTEFIIKGRGRTGPGGSNIYEVHRQYRVEAQAEVIEEYHDIGLRQCLLKGRLVLVNDFIANKKPTINTEEGF